MSLWLTPREKDLLAKVTTRVPVANLVKAGDHDEAESARALFILIITGQLEYSSKELEAEFGGQVAGRVSSPVPAEKARTVPTPSEKTIPAMSPADALFQRGMAELKEKSYLEALQSIREAVSLSPDNERFVSEYAGLLAKFPPRHKDAERYYLKSIELNPGRVENYINLGRLYNYMQLPHRAKAQFRKALEIDPTSALAKKELDAAMPSQPPSAEAGGLKSWLSKMRKET